jgi:hypothetical protein
MSFRVIIVAQSIKDIGGRNGSSIKISNENYQTAFDAKIGEYEAD